MIPSFLSEKCDRYIGYHPPIQCRNIPYTSRFLNTRAQSGVDLRKHLHLRKLRKFNRFLVANNFPAAFVNTCIYDR